MSKFLCTHTVPPGSLTREQFEQFAEQAQHDPVVKGYRSFANLSEGKIVCVLDAPGKGDLEGWFNRMGIPYDAVMPLELEGEQAEIRDYMEIRKAA